jgi:hypothetical protein
MHIILFHSKQLIRNRQITHEPSEQSYLRPYDAFWEDYRSMWDALRMANSLGTPSELHCDICTIARAISTPNVTLKRTAAGGTFKTQFAKGCKVNKEDYTAKKNKKQTVF